MKTNKEDNGRGELVSVKDGIKLNTIFLVASCGFLVNIPLLMVSAHLDILVGVIVFLIAIIIILCLIIFRKDLVNRQREILSTKERPFRRTRK
jgi:hypothetical protein